MPLAVSPLERKREAIREEAARRGLLRRYEFSGVESSGVDRRDAIAWLMRKTREKAFDLLRREFGSRARFWPRPRDPFVCDFFWQRGNIALNLTGPLTERTDDQNGAPRRRYPASHLVDQQAVMLSGAARTARVLLVPYYEVWHHPERFLAEVRRVLVASGKYPNLK